MWGEIYAAGQAACFSEAGLCADDGQFKTAICDTHIAVTGIWCGRPDLNRHSREAEGF